MQKLKSDWCGAAPSTWNFGSNWPRWSEIADFRYIFVRIASTVTPSEKSSINTNRKSTARFPVSPNEPNIVRKSPHRGSKTQCPKFEQKAATTPKRYTRCQLLWISLSRIRAGLSIDTDFVLDNFEWSWTEPPFCVFSSKFGCFAGHLCHSGWRQTYDVRK